MFEILGGALSKILGGKTPEGESQILEMVGEIFKGKEEKKRAFLLALEDKAMEKAKLEIEDTQNARQMQVEALRQDDKFSKRFVYYFSAAVISIILLGLGGLLYFDIPQQNEVLVTRIVDLFKDLAMIILPFYFGTRIKRNTENV
ncbi:hypothetical protein [Christiangramia sp. SM2212]|uniref:TMhelix containing protein n=1 Tax=Christiangramia sediminicola TaxID=3073267 RepID=A0ABU1EQ16_9FLAO|nr:hypothetical protein [Christiangramia sp. SM2212]MDR5590258.1 hypothetical protein [Christiangramia sp. SM2212]